MSETILKFLAAELKTIRVACMGDDCGCVVEVPVKNFFKVQSCPVCHKPLLAAGNRKDYENLGLSLELMQRESNAQVQFILPGKDA